MCPDKFFRIGIWFKVSRKLAGEVLFSTIAWEKAEMERKGSYLYQILVLILALSMHVCTLWMVLEEKVEILFF